MPVDGRGRGEAKWRRQVKGSRPERQRGVAKRVRGTHFVREATAEAGGPGPFCRRDTAASAGGDAVRPCVCAVVPEGVRATARDREPGTAGEGRQEECS